jgi:hypothetical protein
MQLAVVPQRMEGMSEPSIRVLGNLGDRATKSPPNPHPISANSTFRCSCAVEVEGVGVGLVVEGEKYLG